MRNTMGNYEAQNPSPPSGLRGYSIRWVDAMTTLLWAQPFMAWATTTFVLASAQAHCPFHVRAIKTIGHGKNQFLISLFCLKAKLWYLKNIRYTFLSPAVGCCCCSLFCTLCAKAKPQPSYKVISPDAVNPSKKITTW